MSASMIPGSTGAKRRGTVIAVAVVVVAVVAGVLATGGPGAPA